MRTMSDFKRKSLLYRMGTKISTYSHGDKATQSDKTQIFGRTIVIISDRSNA